MFRKRSWLWCAPALLLLAGCGRDAPPLTPVRGQVFYQGRALSQGLIVFTPDADRGGSGPCAKGDIQADGSYRLTTEGQTGAAAGWHRITVAAVETPLGGTGRPRMLVPNRYSDPELSGQFREIHAGK